MEEEKPVKKRGRPPLSPEEKQKRLLEQREKLYQRRKQMGFVSQKKYREVHPDRVKKQKKLREQKFYEPKVRIPRDNKILLEEIMQNTGQSFSELCLQAIQEKYGIDLQNKVDKPDRS